jgi:hypothetical protein
MGSKGVWEGREGEGTLYRRRVQKGKGEYRIRVLWARVRVRAEESEGEAYL